MNQQVCCRIVTGQLQEANTLPQIINKISDDKIDLESEFDVYPIRTQVRVEEKYFRQASLLKNLSLSIARTWEGTE